MSKKEKFPKVVKGSHLTVTHYENGKVDMEWDWDKLSEEIRRATETTVKTKTTKKKTK